MIDDDVYNINCHIYTDPTAYQRLLLSSAAIFLSSSFSCSTNSVHLFARFDLLYIIHHHNDLYPMNNNILWLVFAKQRLHRSSSSLEKQYFYDDDDDDDDDDGCWWSMLLMMNAGVDDDDDDDDGCWWWWLPVYKGLRRFRYLRDIIYASHREMINILHIKL